MRRIRELVDAVNQRYPCDTFFADFKVTCHLNPDKLRYYRTYDDALRVLDDESWTVLKTKALNHFKDHREGQLKQGFFNQLNEAFAYRHLAAQSYTSVRILPETGTKMPDIRYTSEDRIHYCEVKTLGLSDVELDKRESAQIYDGCDYEQLAEPFFRKFQHVIDEGRTQIAAKSNGGLIFIVLLCDDLALDHYAKYRNQIRSYCRRNNLTEIYIKVGLRGRKRMRIALALQPIRS